MIRLSVIIPAYNQEDSICVGLDSIPADNRIETIVVNDGSTDNTLEVVREYKKNNPAKRIRLLSLNQNSGVSVALNKGLDTAIGEYVVFLGSDGDYFYEGSLTKALDNWLDGTDLIYFDMVDNRGNIRHLTPETRLLHTGSVKFMRRQFIGYSRLPSDIRRREDNIFITELSKKRPTEKYTNEIIKHYNYPREGSLSWNAYHGVTDKYGRELENK